MELNGYIACMCEGSAELAIIDILLDNHLLIFEREDLLEEMPIPRTSAKEFEKKYLRMGFEDSITLIRIIDSRTEGFSLSAAYKHKVRIINVITAPEIEKLIIIAEGKTKDYEKFRNSRKNQNKPSIYCKEILQFTNVKKYDFVKEYFADYTKLIKTIKEYCRISDVKQGECTLLDLLKEND